MARILIFPTLTRVFSTLEEPERAVAFMSFLILPLLHDQVINRVTGILIFALVVKSAEFA